MNIVIGFLPYIAFFLLESRIGTPLALALGALVAAGLVVRSKLRPPHDFKMFEAGTVAVFVILALYSFATGTTLSLVTAHLCVKAGILLIVLISMLVRQPFTLAYARQQTDPRYWDSPRLLRTSYIITSAWAVAVTLGIGLDLVMLANPQIPQPMSLVASLIAFGGAIVFTRWYTANVRRHAQAST
jgi:hypothetical protein